MIDAKIKAFHHKKCLPMAVKKAEKSGHREAFALSPMSPGILDTLNKRSDFIEVVAVWRLRRYKKATHAA